MRIFDSKICGMNRNIELQTSTVLSTSKGLQIVYAPLRNVLESIDGVARVDKT